MAQELKTQEVSCALVCYEVMFGTLKCNDCIVECNPITLRSIGEFFCVELANLKDGLNISLRKAVE